MAIETLYPAIRPSLDLHFAGSKTLDPRITFNRASAATYYDGKTVAKAEENLLRYSQMFNAWNKVATSVIENSVAAPDGTMTGATVTADGAPAVHNVYQEVAAQPANTMSVYAKAGTESILQVYRSGDADVWANFDLATGSVGSTGPSVAAATMIARGNGWYRCSIYTNSTACGSVYLSIVKLPTSNRGESNTSTGTLYFWGAQLEQRSQVTDYTPTTTQPITNYIQVLQTAPAGVPRFDHNPVTGESLGLLVEEQRTNLLLRSKAFNETVSWKVTGGSIETVTVAPDGTLSAYKLVEKGAKQSHYIKQVYFSTSGASDYTFSVYVKAAGRKRVQLWSSTGAQRFNAVFDLENFTYIPLPNVAPSTFTSATITPVGNGWCRLSITGKVGLDNSTMQLSILIDNGISHVYTGDDYSGVYLWGAQLEVGAFPTSYIKTEASQVTRAADSASMTGANFSSWYRQDEGTLFAESAALGYSPDDRYLYLFSKEGISSADSIHSRTFTDQLVYSIYAGSTVQAYFHIAVIPAYVFSRLAFAYKPDSTNFAINSQIGTSDTQSTIPNIARLEIPGNACRHYRRLTYYPKRLSNSELQALTA